MATFTRHTIDSAPAASKPLLEDTKKAWELIPTLHATLAESPVALEAYNRLFALMGQSSLSPGEQQIALLTVSVFHQCEYCTMGHTFLARNAKVDEAAIQAVREAQPIADKRLQALRVFTETVLEKRGMVDDRTVDSFIAAGFTRAQALEVVVAIATKTISNYTNHLAEVPKESFMSDPSFRWVAPKNRKAGG